MSINLMFLAHRIGYNLHRFIENCFFLLRSRIDNQTLTGYICFKYPAMSNTHWEKSAYVNLICCWINKGASLPGFFTSAVWLCLKICYISTIVTLPINENSQCQEYLFWVTKNYKMNNCVYGNKNVSICID